MKSLFIIVSLMTFGFGNMSDEQEIVPSAKQQPVPEPELESGMMTLGGRQFWGDLRFCHGLRIQKNVITGHHRLLNDKDQRIAHGTFDECQTKLEQIRHDRNLPAMSGKAVILIHGIGRSSKCFSGMASALKQDGYTVIGFDYPSTRVSIQNSAEYLHRVIASLENINSIDVVCHSMGGLLLRAFVMQHKEPRFRRAVMLGVPNKGAQIADFLKKNPLFKAVMGPAGQQLVTGKDSLIDKLPAPDFEFGVLAGGKSAARGYNPLLPGDNDSTVTVASTRLPGASDFILLPVIHSFLMTEKKAVGATRNYLKSGQFDLNRERQPISQHDITVIK